MPTDLSIPEAPVPDEIWSGTPNVVLDGERYAIGWQRFPESKGGPAYVTARRGILGGRRVLSRYPLTDDGWAQAWAELARRAPATAEKTKLALVRLDAMRLPAGMLAYIPALVLSAAKPPAEEFAIGQAYDLRFGEDGLQVVRSGVPEAVSEYRYADVAAVQLTGFERVLTAPRAAQLVYVLFYGSRNYEDLKENRTYLRVQTVGQTLDFGYRGVLSPEDVRRWLEPVNRAIRQAWISAATDNAERRTEWLLSELSRLAERLEHGTLTRSDFELLRSRITAGY